jgi:hypothetical protein
VTVRPPAPAWLDEIVADPGPPFLRMGTRPLAASWRLGGDDVAALLAEKRRVLAAHHDEVVATLPGSEEPAAELLDELRAEPDLAAAAGTNGVGGTGGAGGASRGPRHPLDLAGRLVPEDLCLLVPRDGHWTLAAGSVCFPSHWRLRDKLGRRVAEVHGPVPHYRTELAARVDRFLDRFPSGPGVWRRNWMVHADAALYAPVPAPVPEPPVTVGDAVERLWFRSERQTLRRLPRSGAVVFTIRTQQVPLGVLSERPELCRGLARAVATWSSRLVAYRGGEALRRSLIAWLRAAAMGRAAG